jgi:hypothetical protein
VRKIGIAGLQTRRHLMSTMHARRTLTKTALEALLMEELRKYPKCAHVSRVIVTPMTNGNWDAGWTMSGPHTAPAIAHEIVRRLREQFAVG